MKFLIFSLLLSPQSSAFSTCLLVARFLDATVILALTFTFANLLNSWVMTNLLVLGIFLSTSSVFIKCILYFVLVAMFSSATIILASKCTFANLLNSSVTINLLESGILLSASSFFFSWFVCLNQQYYQFIICSIFKNIF